MNKLYCSSPDAGMLGYSDTRTQKCSSGLGAGFTKKV